MILPNDSTFTLNVFEKGVFFSIFFFSIKKKIKSKKKTMFSFIVQKFGKLGG